MGIRGNMKVEKGKKVILKIRYDTNIIRCVTIVFIISVVLSGIGKILIFSQILFWKSTEISFGVMEVVQFFCRIGFWAGKVALVSGIILIDGVLYLNRIRKYGYEVPKDRAEYAYDLTKLPRNEQSENIDTRSIRSVVFSALCFIGFIFSVILDLRLTAEWKFMKDQYAMVLKLGIIIDLIWLFFSIKFILQQNKLKFKEDIEIDKTRKNRTTFVYGVAIIIALSFVTIGVKTLSPCYLGIIYRARCESDQCKLEEIGNILWNVYKNRTTDPTLEEGNKQILQVFEQGFVITDWGVPQNAYLKEVAECLEVDSFEKLGEDIFLADGKAQIYVILRGDQLTVTLMNPADKLKPYKLEAIIGVADKPDEEVSETINLNTTYE